MQCTALRPWQTSTHCCGRIVAHGVSWAAQTAIYSCCGHKMFLNKIRNIFCVLDTKFLSATNVARADKRGNICVGNNVSSFTKAFRVYVYNRPRSIYQYSSMAPRLSGQNCKFFKFLLSLNSQNRLRYKENNTKYRSLT